AADEVAATALFLASNEAAYITGATIHVNGGMVML
ncbi:MAG TPA: beta-ketoacyl-ACP reductase, partial [Alphaproteobacteria bacterium]|nr:beta-ketoacyl-ACP reductase [Alphaproteobacteria bacterium]